MILIHLSNAEKQMLRDIAKQFRSHNKVSKYLGISRTTLTRVFNDGALTKGVRPWVKERFAAALERYENGV